MKTNIVNNGLTNESLDNFIQELNEKDTRRKSRMKRFMMAYTFIVVLYIGGMIANILKHAPVLAIVNSLIFIVAFSIFAFLFRRMFLEQKNVNYSMPLITVLSDAKKRYRPWRYELWMAILAALITGIPFSFSSTKYFPVAGESLTQPVLVFGIWSVVIAVAVLAGHLIWRKTKKPLYNAIDQILNELNDSGK